MWAVQSCKKRMKQVLSNIKIACFICTVFISFFSHCYSAIHQLEHQQCSSHETETEKECSLCESLITGQYFDLSNGNSEQIMYRFFECSSTQITHTIIPYKKQLNSHSPRGPPKYK